MHSDEGMPRLPIKGNAAHLVLRKEPHSDDNNPREYEGGDKNNRRMFPDSAIAVFLDCNPDQTPLEQVRTTWQSIRQYLLNSNVRSLLIQGIQSPTQGRTNKTAEDLQKSDSDYWKMLSEIDPCFHEITSFDEVLCNHGIKHVLRTLFPEELTEPYEDFDDALKPYFYRDAEFPTDIECMFPN